MTFEIGSESSENAESRDRRKSDRVCNPEGQLLRLSQGRMVDKCAYNVLSGRYETLAHDVVQNLKGERKNARDEIEPLRWFVRLYCCEWSAVHDSSVVISCSTECIEQVPI
jgi:hypothetical protein